MKIFNFLTLALLSLAFSFTQFFNLSIFGVKPNFAIAAIAAITFFVSDVWEGILLVALSSFVLKFSPYFNKEILIFFMAGIFITVFNEYSPWRRPISNIAAVISYTLIFYLFLFPAGIISLVFLKEIFYNILISGVIFLFLEQIFPGRKSFN